MKKRSDNKIKQLLKWEDYKERLGMLGIEKYINYESWCKGAPRISEGRIKRMEDLKKELDNSIREFNDNNNY